MCNRHNRLVICSHNSITRRNVITLTRNTPSSPGHETVVLSVIVELLLKNHKFGETSAKRLLVQYKGEKYIFKR